MELGVYCTAEPWGRLGSHPDSAGGAFEDLCLIISPWILEGSATRLHRRAGGRLPQPQSRVLPRLGAYRYQFDRLLSLAYSWRFSHTRPKNGTV